MPVFVQFTLLCDTRGCGILAEHSTELAVPSQPIVGPPLPEGWSEFNGTLKCPGCHDCLGNDDDARSQ